MRLNQAARWRHAGIIITALLLARGAKATTVRLNTEATAIQVSEDASSLYYLEARVGTPPVLHRYSLNDSQDTNHVLKAVGGMPQAVLPIPGTPDLVVLIVPVGVPGPPFNIVLADIADGSTRRLPTKGGTDGRAAVSPDGKFLAVGDRWCKGPSAGRVCYPGSIGVFDLATAVRVADIRYGELASCATRGVGEEVARISRVNWVSAKDCAIIIDGAHEQAACHIARDPSGDWTVDATPLRGVVRGTGHAVGSTNDEVIYFHDRQTGDLHKIKPSTLFPGRSGTITILQTDSGAVAVRELRSSEGIDVEVVRMDRTGHILQEH